MAQIPGPVGAWYRREHYAYTSPLIEVGTVLLDTEMDRRTVVGYPAVHPAEQAFFHKAALLVVERNEDGSSRAIILNRPSSLHMDGWRISFGGPCGVGGLFGVAYKVDTDSRSLVRLQEDREQTDERQVVCLHALGSGGRAWRGVEESRAAEEASWPVLPGGLWATSLEAATGLIERGVADKSEMCVAVGCARWTPGQLETEVARGSWVPACTDSGTLLDATWPAHAGGTASVEALDGLPAWETLMRAVGRSSGETLRRGTHGDSQLAEWVRTRMLPPHLPRS